MISIINEDFNIRKIADSGQCFRLNKENDHYITIVGDKILRIYEHSSDSEDAIYKFDCGRKDFNSFWRHYFDLETDYSAYRNKIPKSDKFLYSAADFGKGIRILNQDPWEMLISFIISQRKSIPAIKSSIESLCKSCGSPLDETENGELIYSFPTVSSLAAAGEKLLESCSLGYRVPYIISAAQMVDSGSLDLNMIRDLNDSDLLDELMRVKGVGIKVANCVSLFAYHRIDAFPVDVWIARVLEEKYDNAFPFDRYKGFGGVIQQYMFYFARNGEK